MLRFDFSDFERMARSVEDFAKEQMPFAVSVALNAAAENTRRRLAEETWPAHVTVRNPRFMKAALSVKRSTKRDLRVTIFDRLNRANLVGHARGNTKGSKGGGLAIPSGNVRRTSKGVAQRQRPRALVNSFRKSDEIYQRYGKGGHKLRLMYTIKPTVKQTADVPFETDFRRFMREEVRREFPAAMKRAMQKRKK